MVKFNTETGDEPKEFINTENYESYFLEDIDDGTVFKADDVFSTQVKEKDFEFKDKETGKMVKGTSVKSFLVLTNHKEEEKILIGINLKEDRKGLIKAYRRSGLYRLIDGIESLTEGTPKLERGSIITDLDSFFDIQDYINGDIESMTIKVIEEEVGDRTYTTFDIIGLNDGEEEYMDVQSEAVVEGEA